MIDHIKLFIIMGNLLVGATLAVYIYLAHHRYSSPPLKALFFQVICFNCLILLLLATKYSDVNIAPEAAIISGRFKTLWRMFFAYFFLVGFSFATLGIYLTLLGKTITSWIRIWLTIGTFLLFAGIFVGPFLAQESLSSGVHYHIYENIIAVFMLLELGIIIALPIQAGRLKDKKLPRVVRMFSLLYLSRYPLLILLIIIPQPFRLLLGLLVLNCVPFIWCRFFMEPYLLHKQEPPQVEAMDLISVVQHYKLSPRETEILGLIMAGKSNRDMEEDLFISYHTVKNHVYNIYRKLGVKTRFELLHLISHSQE